MKILLVSHGNIAEGYRATMGNFFGAKDIYAAAVTLEGGAAELLENVSSYLNEWGEDEQVIICSDIMGGSANQTVFPLVSRPNTFLVAGMNLPLILQLHLQNAQGNIEGDTLRYMIQEARTGIVLMNDKDFSIIDEDDE